MAVAGIQGPGKHFMALLPVKLMLDGFFFKGWGSLFKEFFRVDFHVLGVFCKLLRSKTLYALVKYIYIFLSLLKNYKVL